MQNKVTFCKYRAPHPAFDKEWIRYIMRVSALIIGIMAFSMQLLLAAPGYGQGNEQTRISLDFKNTPISKIFSAIEAKADVVIMYENTRMLKSEKVSISVKDKTVAEVLDELLKDRKLKWNIRENVIRVEAVSPSIGKTASPSVSFNQPILHAEPPTAQPITGRVTDSTGAPLVGASVNVKGSNKGTNTNAKGEFTIDAQQGDMLVISFVGYQQQELRVGGNNMIVILKASVSQLDEVVAIAYGTTTQRYSVGNVSAITSKQIENKPTTNALLDLVGEVPGIFITQSSGFSNSGVNVQIQGPNSIAAGNYPLYIIDGVPYASQNMTSWIDGVNGASGTGNYNNSFGAQSGNPLNYLNPQDIESISILKDADATAIYGSRAANGAVIITTKKGKAGAAKVSFNLQQGISQNTRTLEMMNTEQYLSMRRYAYFMADGLTTTSPQFASQYDINGLWDTTRYTNWQKTLLGGTAHYTNIQGTLSGGNSLNQYLLSGNYNRQTTVYPTADDLANQKASFHVSLTHTSVNQKFRAQFSSGYLKEVNRLPSSDLTATALVLSPDAPTLFNPDGSLNWAPNVNSNSTWKNPISYLNAYLKTTVSNLVSSLSLSYQLDRSFKLSSLFGYTNTQLDEVKTTPTTVNAPEYLTFGGSSVFSSGSVNLWHIEPQLTYSATLAKGKLDALIGGTYQGTDMNQLGISGSSYNSDLLLQNIAAAGTRTGSTSASQYRYMAAFARLNYNWSNKYLVNLNARRDGSSRFGDNNKFHNFWSVGAGWIFSEERLFKDHLSWLSFGKIHASYGTTGNDNIGNYTYLSRYSIYSGNAWLYQNSQALQPSGLSNPYLQWELTRKLSGGIGLGFFKDRILFDLNYYRNRSSNQLLSYSLPSSTGFTGVSLNFPATVQNSGLEISLQATIVPRGRFSWKSSFNISANRNKLVSFPGLASSSYYNTLVVGKPIDMVKVYDFAGLNTKTGLYEVVAADGSFTSTPSSSTDRTQIISLLPRYYGGWRNEFGYRNFQLSFLFQFTKQVVNNSFVVFGYMPGSFSSSINARTGGNQPSNLLNYWKVPEDEVNIQQISSTYSNPAVANGYYAATGSNAAYVNGSYVRLKNVSFSYTLGQSIASRLSMQDCRIFVNAQNLLTLTPFKGLDPETGNSALPPLRTITLGIQVGF